MLSSEKKMMAFTLWIVTIPVWFITVFFLKLLMEFQLVMWTLEQGDGLSRIVLTLKPLIELLIILLPLGLSFYFSQKCGADWVISFLLLGFVLISVSFVFGRLDTQGTIYNSLPQAIEQGDFNRARTLVLTVANRYGFSKDVQALIRAGIDVNARDDWGDTVLIDVVRWGEFRPISPELVKNLIQRGVDVNALNKHGDNALFYAKKSRNPAVVKLLLQAGADGS